MLEGFNIQWIFNWNIPSFKDNVQFAELSLYNHWMKTPHIAQQENSLKAWKCKYSGL